MIKKLWRGFTRPKSNTRVVPPQVNPKLLITEGCLKGLRLSIDCEVGKGHEGVAYLLGVTNGTLTVAVTAFRPRAETTPGSFFVSSQAMASVVRTATTLHLQVVAQVHTHPRKAFHSDGDIDGAKIRYPGYSSIVLPNYGRDLPNLDGAAVYMFTMDKQWRDLGVADITIIPEYRHG